MFLMVMGMEDWGRDSQQLGFQMLLSFSRRETPEVFPNASEPYFLPV